MMHPLATDNCSSKTQNSIGAWVKCVRYCMFQIAAIMFTSSVQSHKTLLKLKSKREMNIKAFISRATAKLKLFEFRNQSKEVKIMLITAKYKVV